MFAKILVVVAILIGSTIAVDWYLVTYSKNTIISFTSESLE